jgi:hypothetical protein
VGVIVVDGPSVVTEIVTVVDIETDTMVGCVATVTVVAGVGMDRQLQALETSEQAYGRPEQAPDVVVLEVLVVLDVDVVLDVGDVVDDDVVFDVDVDVDVILDVDVVFDVDVDVVLDVVVDVFTVLFSNSGRLPLNHSISRLATVGQVVTVLVLYSCKYQNYTWSPSRGNICGETGCTTKGSLKMSIRCRDRRHYYRRCSNCNRFKC